MSNPVLPSPAEILAATNQAFRSKLPEADLDELKQAFENSLDAPRGLDAGGEPGTITAQASIGMAVIYGVIKCTPGHHPWQFEESVWGGGVTAGGAMGIIYKAVPSWDAFFRQTTGFHCQGIAKAGGILQITFLNKFKPIGQYNGAMGGIGVFECGGNGRWARR